MLNLVIFRGSVNVSTCSRLFCTAVKSRPKLRHEHYAILGVGPSATTTEIREAYYRKIKTCHPDVDPSPEAAELFANVREAYIVLGNKDRRLGYDRQLTQDGKKGGALDEVLAETDSEAAAAREERRKAQEIYLTTRKKLNYAQRWSFVDEFMSGARNLRMGENVRALITQEPSQEEKNFRLELELKEEKFKQRMQKYKTDVPEKSPMWIITYNAIPYFFLIGGFSCAYFYLVFY